MNDEASMRAREAQYQASVPNNPATYLGAAAGEVAPFLMSGGLQKVLAGIGKSASVPFEYAASKVPSLGGLLRGAGKVASGAAQGGAISLPAPVVNGPYDESKLSQLKTGALVGGAVPIVGGTIGGIYRGTKNLLAPLVSPKSVVQDALQKYAGNKAPAMGQQLRTAQQIVPGSEPTSAQILQSPELVQAEKTIANNPRYKPDFMARQNINNAARINAINSVAGEPGALEAANAERSKVAKNLYDWAFTHQKPTTPWMKGQITQLMKRPAIQQATKDARKLAANEGVKFNDSTSIKGLHYTKTALDDQIGAAVRAGNNNEARILIDTRDKLLTLMEKMSPTYAQARQEFAQLSKPINTMEAGRQISDALSTGALDASGNPIVSLGGFRGKYAKALRGADFGISPEAQATLNAVQKDLQRSTISNAVRTPGSDTAFNLKAPGWLGAHFYGRDFEGPTSTGKIIGGLLGGGVTGHPILGAAAGYAGAEKIGQFAGNRVNDVMSKALLDRQLMADLLSARNSGNSALASRLESLLASRGVPALAYTAARQNSSPQGLLSIKPTAP